MVNWKQICKSCLGICSCFSGRKREEKKKTEEIGLKKLSHANESQIPLVEEEVSEISGENNDNSQTLNAKIENNTVNELTNTSDTKRKINNAQEWLDKNYPKEERENTVELSISHKELKGSLDLKDFVNLEWLDCSNNQLTALDLTNCQKLKYFSCSSNKLVTLNLTKLSQLEAFSCSNNYLTNLDYSFLNDKIIFLDVSNNDLPQQNLNCLSHLVSLEYLIIGNDDEKKINSSIYNRWTGSLKFLKNLRSLRMLIISNTDIDSGTEHLLDSIKIINCSSGERPESKVKIIAEKLNNSQSFILNEKKNTYVSAKKEAFQNAQEWLDCHYPFPNRKDIKWLDISYSNLTGSLKLEGFTNLKDLMCLSNNLTSLEVNSCPKLESINCDENQLTKLELSQCFHLKELSCSNNQLTSLDISHCQELASFDCSDNQLVNLNCGNLQQLTGLYCHQNQLTSLNLEKNSKLVKLACFNNKITDLKVNHCKNLELLACQGNQLSDLDCSNLFQLITLICFNNKLIRLDLKNCIKLEFLNCFQNDLSNLDLATCSKLTNIWCQDNRLNQLNLSGCNKLEILKCFKNKLVDLDLTDCQQLTELYCNQNQLIQLLLPPNSNLQKLICWDNLLTELDLALLPSEKLTVISLQNNNFSEQDLNSFAKFIQLKELYLGTHDKDKIQQGIYNRFGGSLEPLQNLVKLEGLDIDNTDVNDGAIYLPKSIEKISYSNKERPGAKVKELKKGISDWVAEKWPSDEWRIIHPNFTSKLQEEWKYRGFNIEQTKEWIDSGLTPNDFHFAWWLKFNKNVDAEWVLRNGNEQELREECKKNNEYMEVVKEQKLSNEVIEQIKGFTDDYCRGFYDRLTPEQKELIEKLIPNENLKRSYKNFGLCQECNKFNSATAVTTGRSWCKPCSSQRFQTNFKNWTSGNQEIDKLIQQHQLSASDHQKVLEWIPYEQFTNIEYLAEGGFGKVYKAKWNAGTIIGIKDNKWLRNGNQEVVLKSLNNSQGLSADFLQEITNHKLFDDVNIVSCYGISRDPETRNYIMVMEYLKEGTLKSFLENNQVVFKAKLFQLLCIADGLGEMHGDYPWMPGVKLVHRDLHPGNVLFSLESKMSSITDFGLSRPVDEKSDGKVYGVLPYVAPEVLNGKPYTQASDIYSFGIMAYEIISELTPYHNLVNDEYLASRICQGLRPQFPEEVKIPPLLEDLIKRCWDADPKQRPTAKKLGELFRGWFDEIRDENSEFYRQYKEVEDREKETYKKLLLENHKKETEKEDYWEIRQELFSEFCKLHKFEEETPEAKKEFSKLFFPKNNPVYKTSSAVVATSKMIDTKQITQLLQKLKVEEYHTKALEELTLDNFNLDELNLQEESSIQAQVEIPPKGKD